MVGPRNPGEAEVYAVEELLADIQYCIQSVMHRKQVSRSELAKRLGCSPANVTQMLSEGSNLTLDSIARIFHALEDRVMVKSEYLENRRARIWANALDATLGRKLKQVIGTASVRISISFRQESHPPAGHLDEELEGTENPYGYDQAA